METVKAKVNKAFDSMKERFGYTNPLASPRIVKVVVAAGTGRHTRSDRKRNELVANRLAKITGQQPVLRSAKKSIASFKLRKGDPVGVLATLRGTRMVQFLDKFLNIALPRTKDFRGISTKAVDEAGNLTIGIREHTIFPETSDEDIKDVFGLSITIVTTAKNHEEALEFFKVFGVPFRKGQERKSI